ncbi:MAG TPA: S8 family serine peptidase [Gaiellaceae bacterium]|nr:S8 family serine peptidase [Gaiellaceae bacterium]
MKRKRSRLAVQLVALAVLVTAGASGVQRAEAGSATVDVIVQLDGQPAGIARAQAEARGESFDAASHLASLRASQDRFLERLAAAGIAVEVLSTVFQAAGDDATSLELRYFWTLNGLSLRVPDGTIDTIASVPGVRHVEAVREVRAFLDTSVPYTRATSVWEDYGYRGEGIAVGDIDTGIAWDHPMFSTDPATPPGPLHPKVKKYYTFTEGLYDGHGHGTHVGGIIAGDSSLGHAVVNPLTGYGEALLDGMAPKADLYGYKVLSDAGTGLNASIVLAVDQSVADEADVINLSLGSNVDNPNSADSRAVANAMAAGVFVAVAAGNAGPTYSSIGTPATRQEPLTVGSSTDPGNNGYHVVDRADGERFQLNLMSNSPAPPTDPPIEELYVHVGLGCSLTDYATRAPVAGRIALIERGVCTFSVKKDLAELHGAAAAIIYNNVSGNFSGTMSRSRIVVGALSDVDGQHLVTHTDATGLSSHTLLFDPEFDSRVGQISGFSSRGPTDDYRIKPDIVAPGDSVTSAVPQVGHALGLSDPSGYADAGGTSMAAPHMAGAAALVRQAHPDWTTREVKAAFMNTARSLTDPADGKPYSIMDQGAGVVDVRAAIDAPALVLEPSHSFQVVTTGGGIVTRSHAFVILDKSGSGGTWSLSWQDGDGKNRNGQGRTLPAPGWSQSFSTTSVALSADGSAEFTFSITLDGSVLLDGDYEGRIVATNGDVTLTVPVFARHERGEIGGMEAPTLEDPGETSASGSYELSWSDVSGEAGYRVQEATSRETVFSDDAEAGMEGRWTTGAAPNGWVHDCLTGANSGECAYWSGQADQRTATLTLASPVSVPAGSEATLSFASYEDTEPTFDFGYVEASDDGGVSWVTLLRIDGWSGGWIERHVDLTGLSGDVLVRFRYVTDQLVSAPLYLGWWVDDVAITVSDWATIGDTGADETAFDVSGQEDGTYFHRVAGLYDRGGSQPIVGPWSNVVDITVERAPLPDLVVTDITANNNQRARQGEKVTVTATISNTGDAPAGASVTEFLLDGTTVLGLVETPAIPAGGSATVSVNWDTRAAKGEHEIRVTADRAGTVEESDETNNSATRTVTVQGNRVQNGSFEQSGGSEPEGWSGSSTDAGTASSSDGEVVLTGTGGSALLSGSPTWTSAPVDVTAGETLDLVVAVRTSDLSSAATVGLVYLDAAGLVLDTVALLTGPLTSDGFMTLEEAVTIPAGVGQVRVVLTAFAPTDTATRGTATFDLAGLYSD